MPVNQSKKKVHSLKEAQELILSNVNPLSESQEVPLLDALGRISYDDITAPIDQPPFDRSPLDGFALNHKDTKGASYDRPAALKVAQCIFAGDAPTGPLAQGEAARIMTGSMLPAGADCVIRQEEVKYDGDTVFISREVKSYDNYCFKGEDLKKGDALINRGMLLNFADIGILAGQGIEKVSVFCRPLVGLLVTGDELSPAGAPLVPGKIYDSNLAMLAARLTSLGINVKIAPSEGDTPEDLARAVDSLMESCDMVITTGGVSVGQKDCMPKIPNLIGAELLFHGLSMKPGSPALSMLKKGKVAICLSGNPFAAAATFEVLARTAIEKMCGRKDYMPVRLKATAKNGFSKSSRAQRLIRARIEGTDVFIPEEGHSSGSLSAFSKCNCLVDIPAGSPPVSPGTPVEVILLY